MASTASVLSPPVLTSGQAGLPMMDHLQTGEDRGRPAADLAADRSVGTLHHPRAVRSWPLLVLAAPNAMSPDDSLLPHRLTAEMWSRDRVA